MVVPKFNTFNTSCCIDWDSLSPRLYMWVVSYCKLHSMILGNSSIVHIYHNVTVCG